MKALNFQNDAAILEATKKNGRDAVLSGDYMPDGKDYVVTIDGKWSCATMTSWCNAVRNEYRRRNEWQESQAATKRGREGTSKDDTRGEDASTEVSRGGRAAPKSGAQDAPEELQEYVEKRTLYVQDCLDRLSNALEKIEQEKEQIMDDYDSLLIERKSLEIIKEELCTK